MSQITFRRFVHAIRRRVGRSDELRGDGVAIRPPEWLVLGINNVCNLKCAMCDVGLHETGTNFWANLIGSHPQNMSLELLQEIIRQAAAFSPRPKIGLAFTEPLIHPRVLDFCRTIVSAGFYCEITTNGTALARHADELVAIGVHELVVSIDGSSIVHDEIRGAAGTFAKIAEGVERLRVAQAAHRRRTPRLGVSFTISDRNHDRILDAVQAIEPFAPSMFTISHLNFISTWMADAHNAANAPELSVSRSNLGRIQPEAMPVARLFDEIQRVKSYMAGRPAFPRVHIVPDVSSPARLATYYQDHLTFVGGRRCTDPWKLLGIRTDGSVIPAHGRCYDFPIGSLTTMPLVDLWNHRRLTGFRQRLNAAGGTLPACARCCGVIGKP